MVLQRFLGANVNCLAGAKTLSVGRTERQCCKAFQADGITTLLKFNRSHLIFRSTEFIDRRFLIGFAGP